MFINIFFIKKIVLTKLTNANAQVECIVSKHHSIITENSNFYPGRTIESNFYNSLD